MVLIALVAAYPIIYAVWLSLHEYSVRQAGLSRWAGPFGLRNYSNALQNSEFWDAMVTTLIFTVSSVFLELIFGLCMALAMHAAFKGQGLLRTVVLVPWAILTVVTAIMWRAIFDANLGFVNSILGVNTVWLGEEPHALIVIFWIDRSSSSESVTPPSFTFPSSSSRRPRIVLPSVSGCSYADQE